MCIRDRRVAICDQLEDPKLTKKLVKRGITALVTPGVSINDNVLNYRENNFLAAVHFGKGACEMCIRDSRYPARSLLAESQEVEGVETLRHCLHRYRTLWHADVLHA